MTTELDRNLVELQVTDGIALVRLNRPEQLNALSDALLRSLEATLEQVEADESVRAVVLTGTGEAFCAGADLSQLLERLDGRQDAILDFVRRAGRTFRRLETSRLPAVAAVNGTAVAGGFELILACDVVFAAPGVRMGDGHLRYGVLPGGGGAVRLERKIPPNAARRLLLTGDLEPAERFREWGLVEEVVPAVELVDRAVAFARRLATRSARGLAEAKRVATAAWDLPTEEALGLEYDTFADYVASDDLREGLRAFRDRARG
ncbi:enoyl-CoA hydratase/isomerase family protein [Pseudonocardia xishanensis]|uniref:Enoyl-CoA hydratase/isomerase family protein n=1 Tax=Pseudonocardia xishanensis TaxID=630995 RepID=A0ABP8RXG4_9PSEU